MGGEEYEPVEEYEILGIKVTSEIVKDEIASDGGSRNLVTRSSCKSDRWGVRTRGYSYSCPTNSTDFRESFERTRFHAAEALVQTELGQVSEKGVRLLLTEVCGPSGKKVRAATGCNLGIPMTLLGPETVKALRLMPTGEHCYERAPSGVSPAPLYKANIKFGDLQVETVVAASDHGSPACVLGGDFFQRALRGKEELIHELLMGDHYRALVNAARCKKRYVLITGKYGEHRKRLERIKHALSSTGLVGLILDEYPDIEEQSLVEKTVTYASISRFVIVDDFLPSGHIDELRLCHQLKFVTAVLRHAGKSATAMQSDVANEVSYIAQFNYTSDADFERSVSEAAKWAENAVQERSKALNREYSNWRSPEKLMG